MTLYNKGPFVEEAVRSVLSQTYRDLELLVVDDRGTDDGVERVRSFSDPRVRLISNERNLGRAGAANRGFDEARGEFVAILDADDIMAPERIERQVAFLEGHPEVGVVGSWLMAFGETEKPMRLPAHDDDARALALFGMPVSYGASMFRSAVRAAHGVRCDPDWRLPGMDYLFMLDLGSHTRFANIPECLTKYRKGEQNMRHGRDTGADTVPLVRRMLERSGVPASEEQVVLHCCLFDLSPGRGDMATVRALWAWKKHLERWNRRTGTMRTEAFERALCSRWDRLFHPFADHGLGAACVHMWYSSNWSPAAVRYALSAWAARVGRRQPRGQRV